MKSQKNAKKRRLVRAVCRKEKVDKWSDLSSEAKNDIIIIMAEYDSYENIEKRWISHVELEHIKVLYCFN